MIKLDLSEQEAEILTETLESYLKDLSVEIADTDLMKYREQLKEKKNVLNKIVAALRQTVTS